MATCQTCKTITNCKQFDLLFYNLSAGKLYANPLLAFNYPCTDAPTRTVYIQPATVTFIFPYPVGYPGPYPPMVLGCAVGGTITRTIPNGATQDQIDSIINEMIFQCCQAIADSQVPDCAPPTPTPPPPDVCADGITSLLNNKYSITGYVDGLFANSNSCGSTPGNPTWDGSFYFSRDLGGGNGLWAMGETSAWDMDGKCICNSKLTFECIDSVPIWTIIIECGGCDSQIWVGEKSGGETPEGVYLQTGGTAISPANITIQLDAGSATALTGPTACCL